MESPPPPTSPPRRRRRHRLAVEQLTDLLGEEVAHRGGVRAREKRAALRANRPATQNDVDYLADTT